MYRVEQVLVPVDFSHFSRCALAFARQLGSFAEGKEKPRLQLAHAMAPMAPYMRSILFPYAALGEDDREFEAEISEEAQNELARYFEIDGRLRKRFISDPVVEFGASKDCISRWAGSFDVDMIALGAFGENGVFAGGLGSTAQRILQTSTRPVAIIRDYDRKPKVRKILVAIDLGKQSSEVLRVALGLAIQQEAQLELLHVLPSPFLYDTSWILEKALPYNANKVEKQVRPKVDALFEQAVEALEPPFAIAQKAGALLKKRTLRQGDPAEEIAAMAYEEDFDLVVVGANNRQTPGTRSLGRVASAAVVSVPKHLVVVPPRREATPLVEADD